MKSQGVLEFSKRFLGHPRLVFGASILLILFISGMFGSFLAPYDPIEQDLLSRKSPPSLEHLLGTDIYGRDMLSRILVGSRSSLLVGGISVLLGLLIGGACGLVAGYYGGVGDNVIMRFMDLLLALPSLILALVIVTVLGANSINAIIAIAVWFIPNYARLARSTTLCLRQNDFIEAAKAVGSTNAWIILRHILPNALPYLIVYSTLNVGTALLLESALSFLGLGIQPPNPSWGSMINEGRSYLQTAPHLVTIPGLAIIFAVSGFNMLGESLRDITDPKTKFY